MPKYLPTGVRLFQEKEIEGSQYERKTSEQKADEVSAFISTARSMGKRATFVGGFAYYSLGLVYQESCCYSNVYYAINITALILSIMAAGFSEIYVYYAERNEDQRLQYEFCIQGSSFNRLIYVISTWASVFYTIGIGLIPWANYESYKKKWIPLIFMVFSILYVVPVIFHLRRLGQLVLATDADRVEKVGASRSESLENSLLKQSEAIAGRAIFISGLAQHGLLRFMPAPNKFDSDDHAAHAYLVFVSLAMALSFSSGYMYLLFQSMILNIAKAKQQALSILIYPTVKIFFYVYILGFVALFLANTLVGFGGGFRESEKEIPIFFGGLGCVMIFSCLYSTYLKPVVDTKNSIVKKSKMRVNSILDKHREISPEKVLENIVSSYNSAGAMSTFAALYIYENLILYATEVAYLPSNEYDVLLVKINLAVNMFTLTAALYSSVADTILSWYVDHKKTVEEKVEYLDSRLWVVNSCIWSYYLSLIGWFLVFALFGFLKFIRASYVPIAYSLLGFVVMVVGTGYLSFVRHAAVKMVLAPSTDTGSETRHINSAAVEKSDEYEVAVSINRPATMNSLGLSVIFLGGFAYFAVKFFNFRNRIHEDLFLHSMCICFMTSMWVMVFADRYNYQSNKCPTEASKILFSKKTYTFYCLTIVFVYIVIISLLVGLSVLGNVKAIDNFHDVDDIIKASALIVIALSVPMVLWILNTFRHGLASDKFSVIITEATIERYKTQMQVGLTCPGFVAGNVLLEMYFSEADSNYHFINKYYFFMMCSAVAFAITSIIISTLILFCLEELSTIEKKSFFVFTLRKAKLVIFLSAMGSLFSWQASIIAFTSVKYNGEKGGDLKGFVPGMFGLLCLLYGFYKIKKISDNIVKFGSTSPSIDLTHSSKNSHVVSSYCARVPNFTPHDGSRAIIDKFTTENINVLANSVIDLDNNDSDAL